MNQRALTTNVGDRHRDEHIVIFQELVKLGWSVDTVSQKAMERGQVTVQSASLVFGDIDFVRAAVRASGHSTPEPIDYPPSCARWLRRKIWKGTLKQIPPHPVFVKPSKVAKKFTGVVLDGEYDAYKVESAGRNTAVWFSEVVTWTCEWRLFVCHGEVLAMTPVPQFSESDFQVPNHMEVALDMDEVHACLRAYCDADAAPAGFAADFGVLADGSTALVEINDGFAFGIYSTEPKIVDAAIKVMTARWNQLVGHQTLSGVGMCEVCNGTGLLLESSCPLCDGHGQLEQ